jgi:hypothetical protein
MGMYDTYERKKFFAQWKIWVCLLDPIFIKFSSSTITEEEEVLEPFPFLLQTIFQEEAIRETREQLQKKLLAVIQALEGKSSADKTLEQEVEPYFKKNPKNHYKNKSNDFTLEQSAFIFLRDYAMKNQIFSIEEYDSQTILAIYSWYHTCDWEDFLREAETPEQIEPIILDKIEELLTYDYDMPDNEL